MPIRFRCAYCNQLLGIARRKAGTVVRCPTCAGQILVPKLEAEEAAKPRSPGNEMVFERSDFDELLNPPSEAGGGAEEQPVVLPSPEAPPGKPPALEAPPGAWGTHAEPAFDVERVPIAQAARVVPAATPGPTGIVLSPAKATLLTVLLVAALVVAFGAGLLVGLLW
jgi:hypothetical protein